MGRGRPAKEYALYKGESILAMGTKKEIAEELKLKTGTVDFYASPTYARRGAGLNSTDRRVLVDIGDDD